MAFSDYKVALVTGASGGIGGAIAERFAKEGLTVHAVGRNKEKLDELADRCGCVAHAIDIADTQAYRDLIASLDVDVMVNNAGIDHSGTIHTLSADQIDAQVDINFRAVLHGIAAALPGMIERDRGHIINTTSIAAAYSFPSNTIYHATKAGVRALTNNLRHDVYGKRIRVTELCPARVATEIFGKVHGNPEQTQKDFVDGYEILQPEDISDAVANAVDAPSHVNVSYIEVFSTFQVEGGLRFERYTAK
ncbi:NADP-dependent 3-hydroxy acid dehydrogenase YdfG [Cohaesibacter marisflavi]|uniref:NADP-dependent 3-hydroxy acid dehydrogenase YdfG n=1 Tax=Cohaesibacter marisflavi TaxID=655353 RepID=A0A1I5M4P6_9HYPH|nr:SDR family oxidoreductase [Cohaesibacter marisflavi]SFP03916.1 NADP-dependent 3-hydroxy acid dehydrogenase YdfG [Cohaesibacter marisflavi]